MKVDMVMPQMGESIAEATISKWLKGPGDSVEKDEIILEISTDKVDSEIPAPAAGVISELLFAEGSTVAVKEKIATIDTEASAGASASTEKPAEKAAEKASNEQPPKAQQEPKQETQPQAAEPAPQSEPAQAKPAPHTSNGSSHPAKSSNSGRFFSPLVRSMADKHGIALSELENIKGTGQGGRLTKNDLLEYMESKGHSTSEQPSQPGSAQPAPSAPPSSGAQAPTQYRAPTKEVTSAPSDEWGTDGTKVVPMDNMRQIIADHMVRSKQTSPHVYSMQEVDMSKVAQWRAKHKSSFQSREGFGLSFTPFFLEAAVRGLLEFPLINSSVEGNKIIMKRHINLGCAVALGSSGLIVPVIKQAEERNFVGLARALNDLALRARNKKLVPDEVMGGTFTVTNPGVFGTMIGTPIINQPQVAILCLGQIKKRPVVVEDMIAIREICYLTLSYDHRIIDGSLGGQYLAFIREYLENWDMERPLY